MTPSQAELAAMRRAIALSAFGIGSASPNPPVGCVILDRTGRAVGEGYHRRKGEAHAEANALTAAGPDAHGGTAVVTLEPCNHQGLTPPCRQALLDAGVVRVIVAAMDPTSREEGGIALLRQAGVDVEIGVLEDEALVVLEPWLNALRAKRPVITWAYAVAVSGEFVSTSELLGDPSTLWPAHDAVLTNAGLQGRWLGRPGRHGQRSFVPLTALTTSAGEWVTALHAGGTRRFLVDGAPDLAHPLVAADLVDRVIALVEELPPSHRPRGSAVFPPGYAVATVERRVGHVLLTGGRVKL